MEHLTTSAITRIYSRYLNISLKKNKCSWETPASPRNLISGALLNMVEINMVFGSNRLQCLEIRTPTTELVSDDYRPSTVKQSIVASSLMKVTGCHPGAFFNGEATTH
nr:hypothetical protein Iba_chr14aCG4510 [Ipomoea batatas]